MRAAVARYSGDSGAPAAAVLARGPLQPLAERVRKRTGALFVVLTDDHGIRLAHPDPARLGSEVSTDYRAVVAGKEIVSWETGTLGESARAKVPVYGPGGVSPVGEVSVGFASVSVFEQLPQLLTAVGAAALAALAIGAVASVLLRRRLARLTLGVQPEELTALVQDRAAVLDGVGEGVLAADSAGRVTVCNGRAAELLGVEGVLGAPVAALGLPAELAARLADQRTGSTEIVRHSRVLYVDVRRVERAGRDLCAVVVRDRTDLVSLTRRLDAVATMTNALRAQRHEFANRLHVVSGLLAADRCDEARAYLGEVVARGPLKFSVQHADRLQEPYLQALLGAKGEEAAERGVLLSLGAETLVRGTVCDPEDVATVIGNLIDNAVRAAVAGEEPRWVEVDVLDDGDTLYVTVSDSGDGMRDPLAAFGTAPFAPASATTGLAADSVHGSGFGLPLSRALARRRGGDVWVIDPGGSGSGAVLCARLPGTVEEGAG
ncbi:sensor histidine kinase [Leifsonia xyli]|uniref:sensor histidine kinase n=1 Tax=Leifsonia xyli TaxID=1575 RepID=UPI0002F87A3C|nr:ATP-binding protein [Leifsonia xyli]